MQNIELERMLADVHYVDFRGGAGQPYIISSLPIDPCAWALGKQGSKLQIDSVYSGTFAARSQSREKT